jgi:endonuclease/exonuclease/phosphatase family metal-dependent hydrolase
MNNIAFWNIRGANLSSKQVDIKNLIFGNNIQIMCISETKLDTQASLKARNLIAPSWLYDDNFLEANHGRLLTLWNPIFFKLSRLNASDQFIHYLCLHLPSNVSFHLTSVYAHNSLSLRQDFLNFLPSLKSDSTPWLIGGDFNSMYASNQKFGGCPLSLKDISPLNSALIQSNLFSAFSIGPDFTWSNNNRNGNPTLCKLDHIFLNISFLQHWPKSFYKILNPSLSDHCPLLFHCGMDDIHGTKHSFKFFNFWTKQDEYFVILKQVWNLQFGRDPMSNITFKMKALKFHLRKWSATIFGKDFNLST